MWDIVQSRRGETFIAHTSREPGGPWAIGIVRPDLTEVWEGFAVFPSTMIPEIEWRFHELESDIDVENLLREWGDTQGREVTDFISFVAEMHERAEHDGLHGEDDLPDLILPEDLVRPGKKKAKGARKPKSAPPQPPYVRRAFPRGFRRLPTRRRIAIAR